MSSRLETSFSLVDEDGFWVVGLESMRHLHGQDSGKAVWVISHTRDFWSFLRDWLAICRTGSYLLLLPRPWFNKREDTEFAVKFAVKLALWHLTHVHYTSRRENAE